MVALVGVFGVARADDIYRAIGQRIKEARDEAGLTQDQLAKQLGMSDSGLTLWETGKRRIPIDQLRRLSQLLDRPVWWFLGETPPSPDAVFAHELHRLSPASRERAIAIIRGLREADERIEGSE